MLFNSIAFAIFFPIFLTFYWLILGKNLKLQNLFILIGSYVFYGWWDYRFLSLLFSLSATSYLLGLSIQRNSDKKVKTQLLILGLLLNITTLVVFKYFNFFSESFRDILNLFGFETSKFILNIILPFGISFYTFLSISYIVDVYKSKIKAEENILNVLISIGFFPILIAGPIERPATLIPQLKKLRVFDSQKVEDGLRQVIWGLFMKIVIADNCAVYANKAFDNISVSSGGDLLLGTVFYSIQIYSDFAGYSNIAIGLGRMLGFDIMRNFNYPYFAKDIKEFWQRWNISLTNWFRDYIFLPIAFASSRSLKKETYLGIKSDLLIYVIGIVCTWLLTGLWHGASYNFIVWGLIQGFFLVSYHIAMKPRKRILKRLKISNSNGIIGISEYLFTLAIMLISWIFFRTNSVTDALSVLHKIFTQIVIQNKIIDIYFIVNAIFIIIFFTIEATGRRNDYTYRVFVSKLPQNYSWFIYYVVIMIIFLFGGKQQQFIYLQF